MNKLLQILTFVIIIVGGPILFFFANRGTTSLENENGENGDLIAGTFGVMINLGAAILIYLSFRRQTDTNKEIETNYKEDRVTRAIEGLIRSLNELNPTTGNTNREFCKEKWDYLKTQIVLLPNGDQIKGLDNHLGEIYTNIFKVLSDEKIKYFCLQYISIFKLNAVLQTNSNEVFKYNNRLIESEFYVEKKLGGMYFNWIIEKNIKKLKKSNAANYYNLEFPKINPQMIPKLIIEANLTDVTMSSLSFSQLNISICNECLGNIEIIDFQIKMKSENDLIVEQEYKLLNLLNIGIEMQSKYILGDLLSPTDINNIYAILQPLIMQNMNLECDTIFGLKYLKNTYYHYSKLTISTYPDPQPEVINNNYWTVKLT